MSDMSDQGAAPEEQLTEEQLRQLDAEIDRIHVDDVIMQTIVSLINLGARKGAVGAPPEAGIQPDYEQLRITIEAARGLLALVEPRHGDKLGPFRDALAQLQMAYAKGGGPAPAVAPPAPAQPSGAEPQGGQGAPAGGRLWIPGQ
jgi:hypothetical protein